MPQSQLCCVCLFSSSRGLQPLYRISDLEKRDTEGQEAANGNPLPGHSCGACWRGKKGNHLSWDCSWTICLKGPGYLKWFLPFEMQTFWECYEHRIKDPFCKEKGDISHHCPSDLLKPSGLISQCALLRCGP